MLFVRADWLARRWLAKYYSPPSEIKLDFKSNSRYALVRFWNHAYDFRPNCTPLSSITIINIIIIIITLLVFEKMTIYVYGEAQL